MAIGMFANVSWFTMIKKSSQCCRSWIICLISLSSSGDISNNSGVNFNSIMFWAHLPVNKTARLLRILNIQLGKCLIRQKSAISCEISSCNFISHDRFLNSSLLSLKSFSTYSAKFTSAVSTNFSLFQPKICTINGFS